MDLNALVCVLFGSQKSTRTPVAYLKSTGQRWSIMATSKKSTGKKLKDQTSSVAATPVNLLVRLANGEEKKIRATCGLGLEKPLANYDPDTQSWKMFGDISLWGDCPLLLNLPPSGMTRNGVLFLQPAWEPITGETELLLWPTPTTQETEHPDATLTQTGRRLSKDGKSSHSLGLADAARLWPTPTASGDTSNVNGKFKNPTLGDAVRTWPTPRSSSAMSEDMDTISERMKQPGAYKARLEEAVAMETWPTPTASDWKGRGPNSKQQGLPEVVKKNPFPTMSANGMGNTGSRQMLDKKISEGSITEEEKKAMSAGNGGKLNPTWVEWLMGFPTGWTDLED